MVLCMEFFATCPQGFEQMLADELRTLRAGHVRPLKGQVSFDGELADAYRICLWSQLASRVVAILARVGARDADELYQELSQIAWEDHLAAGTPFAIDAQGTNKQLRNTQFIAQRAKDALVDRLSSLRGARPIADPKVAGLRIVVRISRDRAMVGVDLVGDPLFRRGYEPARGSRSTVVPLRPDYAATLLRTGGWEELCRKASPTALIPFVGAGTLAVEAALPALDRAPGLLRSRWAFTHWAKHDPSAWETLLAEARARADAGAARHVELLLADPRVGCERAARQALRAAGIAVEPKCARDVAELVPETPTLLACDLSWIEGFDIAAQAAALDAIGRAAEELPQGSHASVLAADRISDLVLGPADSAEQVLVGRDEAHMLGYASPAPQQAGSLTLPSGERVHTLLPASDQFAARLAKVYRLRRKWAKREDVSCYRIYDSDLPDYAVSIDLFEGSETPGRWLQIYEYAPPRSIDATLARTRLLDVLAIAPKILDVSPKNCFVRVREKARGGSQYADESREDTRRTDDTRRRDGARPGKGRRRTPLPEGAHLVDEGGLTFEVNFSTRLDCGIFLDHRDTRGMLREMAKEARGSKRFLNLFAYTGTGTCYAADGGALHTTTVDLSRPSLEWAQRNMERNGFVGPEHEFVQADVIAWVSEQRHSKNRWDLIFCDVPTFSNSQRMRTSSFDVQRDHAELLIGVSRLLTRKGVCVFSCNLRTFKIDEAALAKAGVEVEDITASTIPEDFSRNPRIHKCYLVRRTPRP